MRTLVRFTRAHSDDDEIVEAKFGPRPEPADWFWQLAVELKEQDFTLPLTLCKFEEGARTAMMIEDAYVLYVIIDNAPPGAELVPMLQHCFDEGAAGFFEIILEIPE